MKREDDQHLWDLLGQAPKPQVSPFFARNIVRIIRDRSLSRGWVRWLNPRRLVPVVGVAVAIIAAVLTFHHPTLQRPAEPTPDVIAQIDPQDYDVVADLDELLVNDESNLWDDDTQTL